MKVTYEHPLFEQFPLHDEAQTSMGYLPTPYHVYDGHGMIIGGTADLTVVTDMLQNEAVYPLQTRNGRALMAIWVCDFTAASLGAHNELQISVAVTHQPVAPIEDHPLALLKALFTNPNVRMICHGLWNNAKQVVAYNRELLGLNTHLNHGVITRNTGHKSFVFHDECGTLIFQGKVQEAKRSPFKVGWEILRLFGVKQTVQAFSQPYFMTHVVNTISESFPHNLDAAAYLASDTPILQFFDPETDTIEFGMAPYKHLDFVPQFTEHFAPFRFVYLCPKGAQ